MSQDTLNLGDFDSSLCRPLGCTFYFITSIVMVFGYKVDILFPIGGEDWFWGVLVTAGGAVLFMWPIGLVFLLLSIPFIKLLGKGLGFLAILLCMVLFYPALNVAIGVSQGHFEDKAKILLRMDRERGVREELPEELSHKRVEYFVFLTESVNSSFLDAKTAFEKLIDINFIKSLQPNIEKQMQIGEIVDESIKELSRMQGSMPAREVHVDNWKYFNGAFLEASLEIKRLSEIRSIHFEEGELLSVNREAPKTHSPLMTFLAFWFFVGIGMIVIKGIMKGN